MSHGTVGTPAYMAPEVIRGLPYGELVDIFSFGIILWEIMHETIPYAGLAPATLLFQLVHSQLRPSEHAASLVDEAGALPEPAAPAVPPIPPHVTSLIERCWADLPESRPTFPTVLKELTPSGSNPYDVGGDFW